MILVFGQNRHWGEAHFRKGLSFRFDSHRAEEDVPDNLLIQSRHQRDARAGILSKRVDKVGFARAAKRQFDNSVYGVSVFDVFCADDNHGC